MGTTDYWHNPATWTGIVGVSRLRVMAATIPQPTIQPPDGTRGCWLLYQVRLRLARQ